MVGRSTGTERGRPECPWRSDWVGGWRVEVQTNEGKNAWTCSCRKMSRQGQGSRSHEQDETILPVKMKRRDLSLQRNIPGTVRVVGLSCWSPARELVEAI